MRSRSRGLRELHLHDCVFYGLFIARLLLRNGRDRDTLEVSCTTIGAALISGAKYLCSGQCWPVLAPFVPPALHVCVRDLARDFAVCPIENWGTAKLSLEVPECSPKKSHLSPAVPPHTQRLNPSLLGLQAASSLPRGTCRTLKAIHWLPAAEHPLFPHPIANS